MMTYPLVVTPRVIDFKVLWGKVSSVLEKSIKENNFCTSDKYNKFISFSPYTHKKEEV